MACMNAACMHSLTDDSCDGAINNVGLLRLTPINAQCCSYQAQCYVCNNVKHFDPITPASSDMVHFDLPSKNSVHFDANTNPNTLSPPPTHVADIHV